MYKLHKTITLLVFTSLVLTACKVPALVPLRESKKPPASYGRSTDSTNSATLDVHRFFKDPNLLRLIDTALKNNQELLITLQEIEIARNEVRLRQGQLLPSVTGRVGIGGDKVPRYTSQGAGDAATQITPGKEVPELLTDLSFGAYAHWEADIWNKLHTAKKAALLRYLSTVEGRKFIVTNLVAEIASSYYELLALDNQLEIVRRNIGLQKNALEIVKVQKEAARATELAVQKFGAEVLNSQSLEYSIRQQIVETENRINGLLGRFPQPIERTRTAFLDADPPGMAEGLPSQLLLNRPDIQKAELELRAARLDVQVARAEFLPSLGISSAIGLQAFKPSYLVRLPESLLFSMAGDLAAPLLNRNAIRAEFNSANARQLQALYNYERTVVNAYLEVSTQLARMGNLQSRYALKTQEVEALNRSIEISTSLFASARADYLEVLLTQRDALASRLELVERKKDQWNAAILVYRALGGGWN